MRFDCTTFVIYSVTSQTITVQIMAVSERLITDIVLRKFFASYGRPMEYGRRLYFHAVVCSSFFFFFLA